MNKILEDNIKYLANQGIEIDKNFTTEKVSYVQDLKGIDVPVLNVNGTKHMYSTVDALEGVKIQTSNLKILSANVLVVFGSGLLYEVYEVISKWKEEGFVLVIEPDEEVFKANILKCQLALNTDIAKIRFLLAVILPNMIFISFYTAI